MSDHEFLTPKEVRARIERTERHYAKMRARYPDMARFFPALSDELYRHIMERALLGELRPGDSLPSLGDDAPARTRATRMNDELPPRLTTKESYSTGPELNVFVTGS